jgi:ABC-2 type transport system ATP-binding protein
MSRILKRTRRRVGVRLPSRDRPRGAQEGIPEHVIEVQDLARTYDVTTQMVPRRKLQVEAVRGVSFHVNAGEVFGLLGPNAAGKTTIMKMLITTLLPTSGSARVFGHDVVHDERLIRRRIGFLFGGERGLYDRLSALDNLRYFADLYAVPPRERDARIAWLLDLVGLTGREKERVEGYSRGMRQRLHIARSLVHDPPLLFFDEPTIGLDPVAARQLRETVASLGAAGKTIFLTTHYMFEADELCDRIAVLNKGRIVGEGTPRALKEAVTDSAIVEIETDGLANEVVDRVCAVPGVALATLHEAEQAQLLVVQTQQGVEVQHILDKLGGASARRVSTREPTLEDAYIALVTHGERADEIYEERADGM